MDERRIEATLRAGPPDEPIYQLGALERGLAARTSEAAPVVSVRVSRGRLLSPMSFAAAVLVVAIIIGGLFASSRSGPAASASSAPSPTLPSVAPSEGAIAQVPAALVDRWVGPVRPIAGLGSEPTRAALDIRGAQFRFDAGPSSPTDLFRSALASDQPGTIRFSTSARTGGCELYDVGTYRWSLSPGGTSLTLAVVEDACSAREAAIAGTWVHTACREATIDCLGPLEAGTYGSTDFDPLGTGASRQLTYTVGDGWSNTLDFGTNYFIRPTTDYLADPASDGNDSVHGVYVWAGTVAAEQREDCAGVVAPDVARSADAIATHLATLPGLRTTDRGTITIDGGKGRVLDLELEPFFSSTCPESPGLPYLPLITFADRGSAAGTWGTIRGSRQRVILLDVAKDRVASVWIDTSSARFDELVDLAMPIIESMHFEGASPSP